MEWGFLASFLLTAGEVELVLVVVRLLERKPERSVRLQLPRLIVYKEIPPKNPPCFRIYNRCEVRSIPFRLPACMPAVTEGCRGIPRQRWVRDRN